MSKLDEFKRHLGIKVSITLETVMDLLGETWKWVENRFSEPEVRMRRLQEKSDQLKEFMAEDRLRATERAVFKGSTLLELRALNGRAGWDQILHSLGVSRRTAQNLIALALFSRRSPEVFEKLKRLGPTKLYRLARLAPEAAEDLRLDAEVETERGTIKFGNLTDRELEAHLRRIKPPRIRTTQEEIRAACVSMRRMLENIPPASRPPREDLESIREILRDVSLRVADLIGKAA